MASQIFEVLPVSAERKSQSVDQSEFKTIVVNELKFTRNGNLPFPIKPISRGRVGRTMQTRPYKMDERVGAPKRGKWRQIPCKLAREGWNWHEGGGRSILKLSLGLIIN